MSPLVVGAILALALSQTPEGPPPTPPCEGCSLVPKGEVLHPSVHLLERQLQQLDLRIARIDESWPHSSVLLMFTGVSFGPLCTVVGALMIALGAAALPALVLPGIIVLAAGLLGVAVFVIGAAQASRASGAAHAEKELLLEQRRTLEGQLDLLQQADARTERLPLFSVAF